MTSLRRSVALPRVVWLATRAAAPLSPAFAGRLAALLWFVPWGGRRVSPADRATMGPGRTVRVSGREVVVHERGSGPTVLLVHGWADRAASLAPFVEPLVSAGHRVVAVDLPAHGASPGLRTDAYVLADVIGELIERWRVEAVVAHSFGGLVTTLALRRNAAALRRLVLLAPAVRGRHAIDRFGHELRLPPAAIEGLVAHVERRYGTQVWNELDAESNLRASAVDGLIVHDTDDRRVAIEDARRLRSGWHRADLTETRGLGHNRLLRAPQVLAAVRTAIGVARETSSAAVFDEA
jgi:pimeloyl-ACP methyl ester carboxylesterase